MSSRGKATPRKPKAAREAEKQARQLPTSAILKNVGRAAALLFVAGAASPVSQLNLSPVFGSIPASLLHQRSITATALLAFIGKGALKKYLPDNVADYIGVIAYWAPVIQFLIFPFSAQLGIEYGPLIIETLTYLPVLLLSVYAASNLLDTLDLSRYNLPSTVAEMLPPLASYFTVSSVSKIVGSILPGVVGTHTSFTRLGLQMLVGSISAFLQPSIVILFAAPAILHTMLANPHYASESALQKANATLFATQNFTLLARQESVTGYVSVLENDAENAFRLLRCDHSLLGGEWLVTPSSFEKGQTQRETIFSVFVMLEAVRLVEDEDIEEIVPDSQKSALVIGLGIGTAPNALISQRINTTIVELDPVVHYYASKYFNLSPNHTAVIDDAVSYVHTTSRSKPNSFNYIIHDVFTGGAEPVYLFTQEFFTGLYNLLTDDGVVAINYAGDLSLPSTRLVLNTIHSVFPACRLFRDNPRAETWAPGDPDFINMVVFCVKNDHDKGKFAIQFRQADEDDWKGSIARQNFLRPKDELEVGYEFRSVESGGSVMKMSGVGELEKWHKQGAVSHWRIMRTVLPDGVWEMW
ncbi:S-adenosyl-L-methionine-dependent methyltransferase [Lophiotrema nucula]|uniref:S-adenosyl-L-methionine-dependent methyltransferase n=1 Tax=Lophiotrema nucula TaxID=690887 RepID=A0A6A5Z4W5_9PLEO|nr:S-adenosyl-L-methionine-dependent methyltransferase [Lophiotrema nucula]